ncbi:MAG: peptidase M48 [Cyanobacteria bacterium QS_8_64_29]|nr:MAG: peptidase M48 [Cyanobacteria bacterium QS_8_64_29]
MAPIPLLGLKADEFRHPLDREATQTLKQVPGLDVAVRSLLGPAAEQVFYLNNIAASVRVGEQQLPQLHRSLQQACQTLDLEPPELYVHQHPAPNAYTFAMRGRQRFMVLHTSLLEMLTPQETQAVMAHELGHLKCEHGVFLTLANLVVLGADLLPSWGVFLAQSLRSQMLAWLRCAELSCDRAALLGTQDARALMSALMKLAGGSPSIAPQLNLDAFIEQARAYDAIGETQLGEMLKSAQAEERTHPVLVLRAREIDRWARSQHYQALLGRHQTNYNDGAELAGKWRNW